jgi:hypothetical protein
MRRAAAAVVLVIAVGSASRAGALPPWPLPIERADEAPAARAVLEHLQQTAALIDADLEQITRAAERIAAALAADGARRWRVLGDAGLVDELTRDDAGDAGDASRPGAGQPGRGEPVLYLLADGGDAGAMREALAACRGWREAGHVVVLAASVECLRRRGLEVDARAASDVLLDNFEPADAGLIVLGGRRVINTQTVSLAAVGWTLRAEVDSAVARLVSRGEVSTPGEAGGRYLAMLRGMLVDLGTTSWPALTRAADRAAFAAADGGRVLAFSTQPLSAAHGARRAAGDPWLMIWVGGDDARLTAGREDFVIALGGGESIGSAAWGRAEALRRAGRGVCWVTCAFGSWDRGLRRGELRLDPQWPYGAGADGAAGVAAEAVYWLLNAAVLERLRELGVVRG